jgi:hypothetical protein
VHLNQAAARIENEHFQDELLEIAALWQRLKGEGEGGGGSRGGRGGASRSEGGLDFFDMLLEYDRAEEEKRFVFVSQLTEVQRYVSMSPCICTYTYTYRICSELGLGQTSSVARQDEARRQAAMRP